MSTIITNLRIPWSTALPQDNSFNVSRDQLEDPLNQIISTGDIDWGGTNFANVGTLNGTAISAFLLNINNEPLGDLLDVDTLASSGNSEVAAAIGELGIPTVLIQEGGYNVDDLGANVLAFIEGFEGAR